MARTWLYRGEKCTTSDLSYIKKCSIDIFTRLLKDVEPGTEVDSLVDNRRVKLKLEYYYKGTLYSITELANILQQPRSTVYHQLKDVQNLSVVDDILDNTDTTYRVIYKGEHVNRKELAKFVGMSVETLRHKLEGIPSGTDVTGIDLTTKTRKFIYSGEWYTILELSRTLGVNKNTTFTWLHGIENGTDITDTIRACMVDRRWLYRGELHTRKEISHLCGRSWNFVHNTLKDIREYECVDDLIDRDISSRWAYIEWNGTKKSLVDLATDYGIPRQNLYHECQAHGVKKLREYIESYGGDRRLEITERYRSSCDWICDDLWIYKDPETGEEKVLTTNDINKLEVSECRE